MDEISMKLAAWVLRLYASHQVSRGCDDLDWPDWVPAEARVDLVTRMCKANKNDPIETAEHVQHYASGPFCPPAWWLAEFFAEELENY